MAQTKMRPYALTNYYVAMTKESDQIYLVSFHAYLNLLPTILFLATSRHTSSFHKYIVLSNKSLNIKGISNKFFYCVKHGASAQVAS